MYKTNQQGAITASVIIAVTMTLLFLGATAFAVWAFGERQDYKNNVQAKIDAAETVARKQAESDKDNEFAEVLKSPVKLFQGSPTYGSLSLTYPKTYSAYVVQKDNDSSPIEGYFHPNIVPSISDNSVSFGLRIRVINSPFSTVMKTFDNFNKSGKAKVTPFRAAKVPQTLGNRIDGQLTSQKSGSMIVLPLRDKTIQIWTESAENLKDFDTYVVPSISFIP